MMASRLPSPSTCRRAVLQRGRSDAGRDLARPRAAHAVRDREERRLEDERVLVAHPASRPVSVTRRRAADPHACTCSSVAPILITSPTFASSALFSFEPFTNVPFVEPRSSTHAPLGRGSMRACVADANSSRSSRIPLCASRPTRRRGDLDRLPLLELRARDDEESPRRQPVLGAQLRSLGGAQDDALLRRLIHALRRRAHHEHDEAVEQHEERDLEDQERLVGLERETSRRQRAPEHELGGAHRDAVAVAQARAVGALAVDLEPVRGAEIDDPVTGALLPELGMPARDVDVRERERRSRGSGRGRRAASSISCLRPATVSVTISLRARAAVRLGAAGTGRR